IPLDPSSAHQQYVAGLESQSLPIRGRSQLLGRNSVTLAGVELDAVRGGEAPEVDQDASPRDAAPRPIMNSVARIRLVKDLLFSPAVVKPVEAMTEMAHAVPLRR